MIPTKDMHMMLLLQVREAGMHVGIALKPNTPVQHVFPYCDAGDIDLVGPVRDTHTALL